MGKELLKEIADYILKTASERPKLRVKALDVQRHFNCDNWHINKMKDMLNSYGVFDNGYDNGYGDLNWNDFELKYPYSNKTTSETAAPIVQQNTNIYAQNATTIQGSTIQGSSFYTGEGTDEKQKSVKWTKKTIFWVYPKIAQPTIRFYGLPKRIFLPP